MEDERRFSDLEFRVEARTLTGVVMKFGEVSATHRERFEPGSIRMADAVHLDLFHDREKVVAWLPDGGLELAERDGAMCLAATLPPIPAADRALAEIRAGTVNGLSVEFKAVKESRAAGVRVIEDAILSGVAIVRAPSYEGARVEARSRARLIWL